MERSQVIAAGEQIHAYRVPTRDINGNIKYYDLTVTINVLNNGKIDTATSFGESSPSPNISSDQFLSGAYQTPSEDISCNLTTSILSGGRMHALLSCTDPDNRDLHVEWVTGPIIGNPFEMVILPTGIDEIPGYQNFSWGQATYSNAAGYWWGCVPYRNIISARQVDNLIYLSRYGNDNIKDCGIILTKTQDTTGQGPTGQSTTAFFIEPSAPDFSLAIGANGGIGVGTNNPVVPLHVERTAGAQVRVENTTHTPGDDFMFWLKNADGKARFAIESGGITWTFDNDAAANAFAITRAGDDNLREFYIEGDGDGHFAGNVYANGVKLTSSRALKTGFTEVDEASLLKKVVALDISQWYYKADPETMQHIGPMAEQFQVLFGLGDGQHLDMVNTTGITFAAIQALEAESDAKAERIAELETQLDAQQAHLDRLKAAIKD